MALATSYCRQERQIRELRKKETADSEIGRYPVLCCFMGVVRSSISGWKQNSGSITSGLGSR